MQGLQIRFSHNLEDKIQSSHIEKHSWYVCKFRLTVLLNHYWNKIRTRWLWCFGYDHLNQFRSYRNIMQFQKSQEGIAGKEIHKSSRLESLKKISQGSFTLNRHRRQHLRVIKWKRYSWYTLAANTIINSPKVARAKFLGSDRCCCCISISKFGTFKNPFGIIFSVSDIYFRCWGFILVVQIKQLIFVRYGNSTSI